MLVLKLCAYITLHVMFEIVWNNTDQERVVLLFDIWHPDLDSDEITAVTDMFSYAREQGWHS
mgnify:CR=1 FL=1